MNLSRFLFTLLFVWLSFSCSAQDKDIFNNANSLFVSGEEGLARKEYRKILRDAENQGNGNLVIRAKLQLGNSYYGISSDSAIFYFEQILASEQNIDVLEEFAVAYLNRGSLRSHKHIYKGSLEDYQEAATLFHAAKLDSMVALVHLNMGSDYKRLSDYDKATEFLLKAEKGYQEFYNPLLLSSVYQTFANVLREQKKFSKSVEYHNRSVKLRKQIGNLQRLAGSYNDLGNTYKTMGKLDSALLFYNLSLHLKDSLGSSARSLSKAYTNIGETFIKLEEFSKAKENLDIGLKLKRKSSDKLGESYLLTQLGELNLKLNNYSQALAYFKEGLKISKEGGFKAVIEENLLLQKQLYEETGNYKLALIFANEYNSIHEEIFNERTAIISDNLRISNEVEKTERDLIEAYQKNEMQQLSLGRQTLINRGLILLASLLILVAILLFFAFRLNRKNASLQKALLHDTQHRTKNFLQTLISLFSFQANELEDPKAKAAIKDGESRANAMMMIHRYFSDPKSKDLLLDFSKYAEQLVTQIQLSFQNPKQKVNLKLDLNSVKLEAHQSTPLALILNELVSNSFKYGTSSENAQVTVILKQQNDNTLYLCVKDNGPGLPSNLDINKLSSSGLKLVHLFVKQLKGDINCYNQNGAVYDIKVKI